MNGGSSALSPNGLSTLREEPEIDQSMDDALEYSEQAALEIGDEIYAFERLPDARNGTVWYRGYVVWFMARECFHWLRMLTPF